MAQSLCGRANLCRCYQFPCHGLLLPACQQYAYAGLWAIPSHAYL